jgi:Spy/CpxP family protein refolding chaperone
MLKNCFLALLAAGVISIAVPFASAQDSQSAPPPQSDQQAPPSGPGGGMRHGPMDPAQHAQMLGKKLNLTADQQTKVQSIFETEHTQMESLHQDTSLSQEDRHGKMMDIHKSTEAQVRTILNPTQQKKWDEMQARRGQWGQGHHGPPDNGDQQAPPPQQ